jgi:predicted O-methyltransferase YrrM
MDQIPSQSPHRQAGAPGDAHCFMDIIAANAEAYAREHTSPMSALLEELERYTLTSTASPSMLTGRVEGKFLQFAVQLSDARNILDIGTFTGYSALAMAEALPPDGHVQTIEHNPDHARIAQNFFNRSPCRNKITLHLGEALQILKTLPDTETDLIFIDADKQGYSSYYRESMRLLRNGGLIVADNALWYGGVFEPKDDESRAMADFNELVMADGQAEKVLLTIRDGIYLIRKRGGTE